MADFNAAAMQASLWTQRRNHKANRLIATLVPWSAGAPFNTGDLVQSNGAAYQCVHGGTSGTVAPGGSDAALQSDGNLDWLFVMPKTLIFLLASAGQNVG